MTDNYAVIEAGGTKFNCALMDSNKNILVQQRIATTNPEQTLQQTVDFFQQQRQQGYQFSQLGLACFGPLDLDADSAHFGHITQTPKPGWLNTPIKTLLEQQLNCQVIIDTDVNAAALAEVMWGAAQGAEVAVYITVGTGIGGGVVINGQPLHGLVHPEIGHLQIPNPHRVECACPYHDSCVEGLAAGSAINKIWGVPAEQLADSHQAWQVVADAIAHLCHNLLLTLSPHKIILGGGVMAKPDLVERITRLTEQSLAGYLCSPVNFEQIIVRPGLGDISGLYGALALLQHSKSSHGL
ncbi:ROK family protein [Neptunicella sp. SCSIO 80796]|uniref:ROK family protein n=1 Tax=Neptunicella plasticusilytica TaxID=3117012 RepID=UPI003A4E6272